MTDDEIQRFRAKFGYAPARLTVAIDAIAVYVNKNNPLTRVSFAELDALYSVTRKLGGAPIRTWGQLGLTGDWAGRMILIKGPSSAQGVYGVFRSIVLAGGEYRLDMHPEPVASSIVQAVATEDGAIGFASHVLAAARTKTLAIGRAEGGPYLLPTVEHATDGSYPLARKLFVYFNRVPGARWPRLCASSCASSVRRKRRKSPLATATSRSTRRSRRANARSSSETRCRGLALFRSAKSRHRAALMALAV